MKMKELTTKRSMSNKQLKVEKYLFKGDYRANEIGEIIKDSLA